MKKVIKNPVLFVMALICFSLILMAVSKTIHTDTFKGGQVTGQTVGATSVVSGRIRASGILTHDKILFGKDGLVNLSLTLEDEKGVQLSEENESYCDIALVLDTSGSMSGKKLYEARSALRMLVNSLTDQDRISIVGYSDRAVKYSDLHDLTLREKNRVIDLSNTLSAGGATNISSGLVMGIDILKHSGNNGKMKRVILISDGLANRGIMDHIQLGRVVNDAAESGITVSAVGVGDDFNEMLMTRIADNGAGNYYYLDNLNAFSEVFLDELKRIKTIAASKIKIEIPLTEGISLVSASGYPVSIEGQVASFYPGDLLKGQVRKIFLTFKVPSTSLREYAVNRIKIHYMKDEIPQQLDFQEEFIITCVKEKKEFFESYNKHEWESMVVQEAYGKLQEDVANLIKEGDEIKARERIEDYKTEQKTLNFVMKSEKVRQNLDEDINVLDRLVGDTFSGEVSEIKRKKNKNSKRLQYGGYQERRNK